VHFVLSRIRIDANLRLGLEAKTNRAFCANLDLGLLIALVAKGQGVLVVYFLTDLSQFIFFRFRFRILLFLRSSRVHLIELCLSINMLLCNRVQSALFDCSLHGSLAAVLVQACDPFQVYAAEKHKCEYYNNHYYRNNG